MTIFALLFGMKGVRTGNLPYGRGYSPHRSLNPNHFFRLYSHTGDNLIIGELAEWLMAAVLKTVDLYGFGGSNPSLSAETIR